MAHGIVFIASDDASFITGHVLNIDGGLTIH
jgi:NAD(P)-dependent dehydrogenase (short-subunit alcohol dehydrogenase family)